MPLKHFRRVVLVELNIYERITPLVSGYLRAYASRDPEIVAAYNIEFFTATTRTPRHVVLSELLHREASVYAFSCYIWNARLAHWLAMQIKAHRPDALIVLGGPQVVEQFKYLDRSGSGVFVCNGEGEQTFADFLRESLESRPDFSRVKGISFYADGEPVQTASAEPIDKLDEIPSPFLAGYFSSGNYTFTTFETNRRCPFQCTFCYWGLGKDRVVKFSEVRVFAELEWIARNSIISLYLADANFGMLKRDVRIAEHIARLKRETGFPYIFNFNSAKNKPESVIEIANIVQGAGISGSQSVAIQSLDEGVLKNIRRSNIKLDAYTNIQKELNQAGFGTFSELIWPLPGETYETFREGVDRLIAAGAQTFMIHPLALLQNTEMWHRRVEHGFTTRCDREDAPSEYELVVSTNEVSTSVYLQGQRFIHAVNALFNYRAGYFLQRHLRESYGIKSSELFCTFLEYCRLNQQNPYVERMERALADFRFSEHHNYWGENFHYIAHEGREDFDLFVQGFARSQPWWNEETRTVLELDLLNRPYVYSNTPIASAADFASLAVETIDGGYRVQVPERWRALVDRHVQGAGCGPQCGSYLVDHGREQLPFMPRGNDERNHSYCLSAFLRIVALNPVWLPANAVSSDSFSVKADTLLQLSA